jgi:hypothetical protein
MGTSLNLTQMIKKQQSIRALIDSESNEAKEEAMFP